MKFSSVLLSVLMAGGLVSATGTPEARQSRIKIVTLYSEKSYQGQKISLSEDRLRQCVDFSHGALLVNSAQLFDYTVCKLYTKQGCTEDSYVSLISKNTTDTGRIELSSIHCITALA